MKKNLLYIHQYFKTPAEPGGTRSYWIARQLIEDGYHVIMLTSCNKNKEGISRITIDGIDVIYIHNQYSNEMSIYSRVLSFMKFMFKATLIGLKEKNIDLVIASSTPLTVGFPALVLKKTKRIPYIFEVRDLWPEAPIQMKILRNPILKWIAIEFEKIIYKNAQHIITLSPGMYSGVAQNKFVKNKISMIPNMAKIDNFWPREKKYSLLKKFGLVNNSFKAIHIGSMGIANGLEYIIDAAIECQEQGNHDIEFIFIGEGKTQQKLENKVKLNNINNVKFLGIFSMTETSEIVNLCDVSLVSFLDIPILRTNSPNKLFDSLSAGKPIIVNSSGWTKDLVEESHCGLFADPKRPQDLFLKIKFLKENPSICIEMGKNSRSLAETKFDKSILCKDFSCLVKKFCHYSVADK